MSTATAPTELIRKVVAPEVRAADEEEEEETVEEVAEEEAVR